MTCSTQTYKTVLSIAGSDPSGGAGIQADIKTCAALGVYAMTAITAVTAQNTLGVRGFNAVGVDMLAAQLDAVLTDITPDAVKIGMIPDAPSARVIAVKLREYGLRNIVLDPVMVATSGDSLSGEGVIDVMRQELFPLADMLTPNLPEASVILCRQVPAASEEDACRLLEMTGARSVLMKGGHGAGEMLTDILTERTADGVDCMSLPHPYVDSPNTHGTGCSLSSAIASFLASGCGLREAAAAGVKAVAEGIAEGKHFRLGHGHGPIHHLSLEKFRI